MKKALSSKIIKIFIFILLFIIADYIIGSIYTHFRNLNTAYPCTDYNKEMCAFTNIEDSIVVIGHSSLKIAVNPRIMEKKLHLNCFNLSELNRHFWWKYMMVDALLNRYNPSIIILGVEPNPLDEDIKNGTRDIPYIAKYTDLSSIAYDRVYHTTLTQKIKALICCYKYNSCIHLFLLKNLNCKKHDYYKGYYDCPKLLKGEITKKDFVLSNESKQYNKEIYAKLLSRCQQKGCKVYCVTTSFFFNYKKKPLKAQKDFRKICEKYGAHYLNFLYDSTLLSNSKYYRNNMHYSTLGAKKFSEMLSDSIMKYEGAARFEP